VVSVSTGLDIECKVLCGVQHEIYILRNHSIPKAWQIRDHRSKNTPSIPEVTIVIDRRQKKTYDTRAEKMLQDTTEDTGEDKLNEQIPNNRKNGSTSPAQTSQPQPFPLHNTCNAGILH
jgi:hypothetical protein